MRVITRAFEFILVLVGLGIVFAPSGTDTDLILLFCWDVLAATYMTVGGVVIRRARLSDAPYVASNARLAMALSMTASLTGLTAGTIVLVNGSDGDLEAALKVFGVVAIVFAWLFLHAAYGRFYGAVYYGHGPARHGLQFPDCHHPNSVDFLYMALTLGTSFAVSDVTVTARAMRWHVLIHGTIAFAYNTAVIAIAISVITSH